ncbi:MAG: glycosyltransferase [Clostridium butyricum]|nr:glycosyltransferase [Clostridium butyricum]
MIDVSIITPVYNVEACIAKNINSIINQTCKDFELILIDDGSKDKSIEIAKELLEKSDVNYRIITQENSGVSVARNRGIEVAKGEYITFLDSDDYFHEKFIELMYNKAKKSDCDVVFCDYSEVNSKGEVLVKNRTNYLDDYIDGRCAALKQLSDDITIGMRSAIYKASVIKENNLRFDSNRKYGEDMIFIVKALMHSKKIISINEVLAYYVIWENSITQNVSLKHLDCYNSYVDLLDYVRQYGECKEIEKFLVEFKIPYSISHIFSVFSRDKSFHGELFKFLNKPDVKKSLENYKIQRTDKNNIRYFIQCKCIRYCPKVMLKIFDILR